MKREEVEATLHRILIEDFRVPGSKINADATFRGSFGMDSLDAVDFIYLVSKTFGLKADVSNFRELNTLGMVVTYIAGQVEKKEQG